MILAGDVGGTKTTLAIFDPQHEELRVPVIEQSYPSREFGSLEAILDRFIAEHEPSIQRAGFGIAGPVVNRHVETPNLPWKVTIQALSDRLGIPGDRIGMANDLVANAMGVEALRPEDVRTVHPGVQTDQGNSALLSAGTGCGMAMVIHHDDRVTPVATEGGHVDFAPRNALEIGLLEHMRKRFGRVSYERVLSGPGLHNIYGYLRDTGFAPEPDWLAAEIANGDPGAAISKAALDRSSDLAAQTLEMFVSIYGAMAGNLALMTLATRGVYIGGGIAPKILRKLEEGSFIEAFRQKGRFTPMMERIPVHVILDAKAALYGAARVAVSL
ncbi:MAG: glucokinase [Blastocatellia bacterium]|nr:glucokinase [Blastocatellia bacterium]